MGAFSDLFQQRFARLLSRVRGGIARIAPGLAPAAGHWVQGGHREPGGVLALAPLLGPHRPYRLYLPSGHRASRPLPLVVMIHGCKQDAESFAAGTRMNALADRERFLVLYPEQRAIANADRCWNWFDASAHSGGGEAAIVAGMVRAVAASYAVDAARVYVAGLSSGGALASILASCYADLFAACAVHSGVMFQAARSVTGARQAIATGSTRDPAAAAADAFRLSGHKVDAIPALVIHGSDDARVHPANAEQTVTQFVQLNRLARPADTVRTSGKSRSAPGGEGYAYLIHDHLFDGRPLVRWIVIEGLEHAWSGGDARLPYNDPRGPDASELIWAFFAEHRRVPAMLEQGAVHLATANG
jgi:poly(hydroxyalkanoate) depolymerase family esterase